MLAHLSITNYAIIENIELDFDNGFTVITGETGAGKSILLGALSLILGKRSDTSILNNKQKKCIIEGVFNISKQESHDFFILNNLDYDENTIIRREISATGKSRAFINDTPVSLTVLKELTSQIIDIHSQHQTLQVKDSKFQINVIDAFASLDQEVIDYSAKYSEYYKSKKDLKELISLSNSAKTDTDYISFQVKEIEALDLKPNEKENIEAELEIINNAEEIKSVLEYSDEKLINSEKSLLIELKNITNSFSKIGNCSNEYKTIYERLSSLVIELEDVALEVEELNNSLNFNPENLSYLNNRISNIFSVERKHSLSSTKEIMQLLEKLKSKLKASNSYEEQVLQLSDVVEGKRSDLINLAKELSKKRVEKFNGLSSKIVSSLKLLGMPDASFKVKHQLLSELNEQGIDDIEFLFTSNKGVDLKALNKVASGGELSRLMLSIKSILASNKRLATIIFDEIDAGVSGDIADKMASIMKQMSENMQVVTITHLPQVAAKAQHHYRIYKVNKDGKTLTSLSLLDKLERIEELAKMLSGDKLSSAAVDNAKILLES